MPGLGQHEELVRKEGVESIEEISTLEPEDIEALNAALEKGEVPTIHRQRIIRAIRALQVTSSADDVEGGESGVVVAAIGRLLPPTPIMGRSVTCS